MEYLIKEIDKDFWKKVKIVAIRKNTTIKDLILDYLKKLTKDVHST